MTRPAFVRRQRTRRHADLRGARNGRLHAGRGASSLDLDRDARLSDVVGVGPFLGERLERRGPRQGQSLLRGAVTTGTGDQQDNAHRQNPEQRGLHRTQHAYIGAGGGMAARGARGGGGKGGTAQPTPAAGRGPGNPGGRPAPPPEGRGGVVLLLLGGPPPRLCGSRRAARPSPGAEGRSAGTRRTAAQPKTLRGKN